MTEAFLNHRGPGVARSTAAHGWWFSTLVGLASFGGVLCLGAGLTGCGSGDSVSPSSGPTLTAPPTDEVTSGSVSLALDVGGATLSSVSYTIIGSGFHTSGSLDVSNATHITGVIGGIPFGSDYSVTLNAASSDATPTTCDGSAAFAVTSTAQVSVPVHLTCKQQRVLVAAAPAPIPPFAILLLGVGLLGLGVLLQRRAARAQGDMSF